MLGIIILNYNTWEESIRCVESIIQNTKIPFQVYLVDNFSTRKLSETEKEKLNLLNVELIYNKKNSGYAAGNNVGLKKAYQDGCNQFLISNSDILVKDNSIDKMCEFAQSSEDIGVVGPLIFDPEGNQQPIYMLSKLTAVGKIKNMMLSTPIRKAFKKFEDGFVMYEKPSKPMKVFGVSGCCFLITKCCYENVFPFDEHTFLYEEEYILGCRLEEKRISAYILPNSYIIHAEGVSTGGISEFSYSCLMESEQYYLKNYLHSNVIMRWLIKCLRQLNWHLIYKRARGK